MSFIEVSGIFINVDHIIRISTSESHSTFVRGLPEYKNDEKFYVVIELSNPVPMMILTFPDRRSGMSTIESIINREPLADLSTGVAPSSTDQNQT